MRPVLHRMSLVEMCVPYGDPNPPYQRKCAFDVSPRLCHIMPYRKRADYSVSTLCAAR